MKEKDESYWKNALAPEQYEVLRLKGTEAPFTGKFVDHHEDGMYACAACGNTLFPSDTKFDSGTGWPSFSDVAKKGNVELHRDNTGGMSRTEVTCAKCDSHLGHLFDDPTTPSRLRGAGKRYCINSCSLDFKSR